MLEVYSLIEKVAKTKTTVLILGESGVGKELVANAIHYSGLGQEAPLVQFNCAAIPENLLKVSCSATKRDRSQVQPTSGKAALRKRTAERSSWMKSATSLCPHRRSCSACFGKDA